MTHRLGAVLVLALLAWWGMAVGHADAIPPGPPSHQTITDVPGDNGGAVTVRFNASPDDVGGALDVMWYEVERKSAGLAYKLIKQVKATHSATYSFVDSGLKNGVVYTYRFWAYDGSNYSTPVTATGTSVDNTPPGPPGSLKAVPAPGYLGAANLTVTRSADDVASHREVTTYEVYRKLASAASWPGTPTLTITARGWSKYTARNSGLTAGVTYAYRARAIALTGSSTFTTVVTVTAADLRAPGAPRYVKATDRPLDTGKAVIVTWTRSSDDGAGRKIVKTYRLYRQLTSVFNTPTKKVAQITATGAAKYQVVDTTSGLTNLRSYTYWAVAVSSSGITSAKSNLAEAVPQDNIILSPPTGLKAKTRTTGAGVQLSWTRSTSEGGVGPPPPPFGTSAAEATTAARGTYEVYRRKPGLAWGTTPVRKVAASTAGNPLTTVDSSVSSGTYEYRVRYRVDTSISPYSNLARASAHSSTAAVSAAPAALSVRVATAPESVAAGAGVPVQVVVTGQGLSTLRLQWSATDGVWQTAAEMTGKDGYEGDFTLMPGLSAGSTLRVVAVASSAAGEARSDEVTVRITR